MPARTSRVKKRPNLNLVGKLLFTNWKIQPVCSALQSCQQPDSSNGHIFVLEMAVSERACLKRLECMILNEGE